jgi:hypothetical protein
MLDRHKKSTEHKHQFSFKRKGTIINEQLNVQYHEKLSSLLLKLDHIELFHTVTVITLKPFYQQKNTWSTYISFQVFQSYHSKAASMKNTPRYDRNR